MPQPSAKPTPVTLTATLQATVDTAKAHMKQTIDEALADVAALPAPSHGPSSDHGKPAAQPGKSEEHATPASAGQSADHGKPVQLPAQPSPAPGRP